MEHYCKKIRTPVGELTLVSNANALVAILWEEDDPKRVRISEMRASDQHPLLLKVETQLEEYFLGGRTQFDIPYEFYGTEFQKRVWRSLTQIPYGQRRSYADIAKEIRSPRACRAVGAANGRNPISIVVPCHRVIGKSGSLTGFAGGLETKQFLLNLECRDFATNQSGGNLSKTFRTSASL